MTASVPQRPRLRGVSHLVGFVAALPLGVLLTMSAQGTLARFAALAFAVSVASMFGVSSLFHRATVRDSVRRRLGVLDHTMIYALIAGTYAPVGLLAVEGGWRTPVLATAWGATAVAVVAKLCWRKPPAWVMPATCVGLGWIAVAILPQVAANVGPAGTALLVAGGLSYTCGAVVYARRRPDPSPATFGFHEVFHLLVVAAVACQYVSVAFFVLPRA